MVFRNALIARLIFTVYALRSNSSTLSLRENLANLLAFFALLAMLVMLISGSRTDLNETERQIRERLVKDSRRATDSLNNWMEDRERLVVQLAVMAQTLTPVQMQTRLAEARASDRNFLRIALLDREGTTIAYSPPRDELGRNNIGKNFEDRPYIPLLKQGLKPMLSEVMPSRFGRTEPVAMMLAPVVSRGEYNGAVGGIMNFDRINTILRVNFPGQSMRYTLLDKNGNVILTNRKGQAALSPFSRGDGTARKISETLFQWIPELPPNISTIELWGRSFYVAESDIGGLAEWRLILEQPVAPFQKMLYDRYSGKIVMMFLILIMLLVIAALLSRGSTFTVEQLRKLTAGLPAKLASDQTIDWPESGIEDTRNLIANFRVMADSLQTRFKEIKEINESLERRIKERTQELQASKDKLSSAAEMARLGHWEYDVVNDLFIFNDPFYRIFRTTVEQAGGYTMSSAEYARRFVHPEDAPLVEAEIRKAIETTDPGFSRQLEHRILRTDGTTGHISVRFFIVKDADGRTVKTYGVNQDVTEQKKAAEDREKLHAQLTQAQKMESVGRLAGGVAHDFNNKLSAILGYTELAMGKLDKSDSIYADLQEVLEAGRQSARIVQQLLAFARKQTMAPEPMCLNNTLEGMLKMLRRLIGEDIDLRWNPDPDLWLVNVDSSQIDQILANLCVNAHDAVAGVGEVVVETKNVVLDETYCAQQPGSVPGEHVMLAVSDNGCGMDMETLDRVFEPFFTTKEVGKGTGLGLSTVYGIVKQNKGFIYAHSEPGKGTTFRIYLPRHLGVLEEQYNETESRLSRGHGETILVVEDDPSVLGLARSILEKLGYVVLTSEIPSDAVNTAREHAGEIHLLMTDVVMPGMNGRDLAEALQNLYPGLKVLFMSGYTADAIARRGVLDAGVHFIQKPFLIKDLSIKVREVLDADKG